MTAPDAREAARQYQRWYRQHRKLFGPLRQASTRCGTRPGYNMGCRCTPCREANARYSVWYRSRNKQPEMVIPNLPRPTTWRCDCGTLNTPTTRCAHTLPWASIDARLADECRALGVGR